MDPCLLRQFRTQSRVGVDQRRATPAPPDQAKSPKFHHSSSRSTLATLGPAGNQGAGAIWLTVPKSVKVGQKRPADRCGVCGDRSHPTQVGPLREGRRRRGAVWVQYSTAAYRSPCCHGLEAKSDRCLREEVADASVEDCSRGAAAGGARAYGHRAREWSARHGRRGDQQPALMCSGGGSLLLRLAGHLELLMIGALDVDGPDVVPFAHDVARREHGGQH